MRRALKLSEPQEALIKVFVSHRDNPPLRRSLITRVGSKASARLVATIIFLATTASLIQAHYSLAEKLSASILVPLGIKAGQESHEIQLKGRCFSILTTNLERQGKLTVLNGNLSFNVSWMGQVLPVTSKFELNFTELDQLGASMLTISGLGESITFGTEGISPINLRMIIGGRSLPTLELPGPISLAINKAKNISLRVPQRLLHTPLNSGNPVMASGGIASLGLASAGLAPDGKIPFSIAPLSIDTSKKTSTTLAEKEGIQDEAVNPKTFTCEQVPLDLSSLAALKDLLRIVT